MSSITHVACLKFARYFDVEARILPVTRFVLDPQAIRNAVDGNTGTPVASAWPFILAYLYYCLFLTSVGVALFLYEC
jgi:glutamate/tyrosine decarboxylase-like PLP-dependent enzyme